MAVGKDDPLPFECEPIKRGSLFRLWHAKCTYDLHTYPESPPGAALINPDLRRLPTESRRGHYQSLQGGNRVPVCQPDDPMKPFAKKGRMFRMNTRKYKKCPFDDEPVLYRIEAQYSEATNPTNTVYSTQFVLSGEWDYPGNELNFDIVTDSIGDPFGSGSSGVGKAKVTLRVYDPTPDNSCSSTTIWAIVQLESLGLPIHWWSGPPGYQEHLKGCVDFQNGVGAMARFFAGVNFFLGPIGNVMALQYAIWGVPND